MRHFGALGSEWTVGESATSQQISQYRITRRSPEFIVANLREITCKRGRSFKSSGVQEMRVAVEDLALDNKSDFRKMSVISLILFMQSSLRDLRQTAYGLHCPSRCETAEFICPGQQLLIGCGQVVAMRKQSLLLCSTDKSNWQMTHPSHSRLLCVCAKLCPVHRGLIAVSGSSDQHRIDITIRPCRTV